MTPQQFWLILAAFVGLIVIWFAAARIYLWIEKRGNVHAIPTAAVEPEPDPDDLDLKWAKFWREADLAYRASDLWAQLHDDADAWVREHTGWNTEPEDVWAARLAEHGITLATAAETARLNKIESTASQRFARIVDRGVRRFGYAGVVDMYAQWIYARRRSVKRMVAVLDKAKGWPPEWQRQLDVLLATNAVGRAEDDVRARRARGEVWAR